MPPVERQVVLDAVQKYGMAWTMQDPSRLADLFTEDAIYVERAFDRKATFRGLQAIENYWKYQIVGKQSNIQFYHISQEMVRDIDQPIAVVKWLAEFDNRREHRTGKAQSSSKTHKRVKFCQMAKLIFDGTKISYLEEYAQDMTGPGVKWPGIPTTTTNSEISDDAALAVQDKLWRQLRFDPEPEIQTEIVMKHFCDYCKKGFVSRSQLFQHLNTTTPVIDNNNNKTECVANSLEEDALVQVCISVSYWNANLATHDLQTALEYVLPNDQGNGSNVPTSSSSFNSDFRITWAVPTEGTPEKAITNVVAVMLPRRWFTKDILTPCRQHRLLEDYRKQQQQKDDHKYFSIQKFHHISVVDHHMLVPERRDFERYVAYLPWKLVGELEEIMSTTTSPDPASSNQNPPSSSSSKSCWRRPLHETPAGKYVTLATAQRMKLGARLLTEHLPRVKIRSGTQAPPYQAWCRFKIAMKLTKGVSELERMLASLVEFCRNTTMSEEEFIQRLEDPSWTAASAINLDLSQWICMDEPFLCNFETKTKQGLLRSGIYSSEDLKASITESEEALLNHMLQIPA